MDTPTNKLISILTGDIISSRKINPEKRSYLFDQLPVFLKGLQPDWISSFETYRGDSIQCQTTMPEFALRIALIVRTYLKGLVIKTTAVSKDPTSKGYFKAGYDIRISIGLGGADFINPHKIGASDGEAFRLSGNGLDKMKDSDVRLTIQTVDQNINFQMEPAIMLLDALIQKWTQNQAEVIYYKLLQKKEEEIAQLLQISQPAVNQRKKTANWNAVEKVITYFEDTVQTLAK